jgi:cyclohexanone monooxygenase
LNQDTTFDAVVVGAGFAGLYMLHRLRELGLRVRVFEAGADLGGTWFWNRYPGARCDVESVEYSYSFNEDIQQEWNWTERYATQPEILRYLEFVADRLGLRPDIEFNSRVVKARFSAASNLWTLTTDCAVDVQARLCVMATGCLSAAKLPEIGGIESFKGAWYHTGTWPRKSPDFSGLRVGVVGTGSSGIQIIPEIAEHAAKLIVFQRTANYSIPARNAPLDQQAIETLKRNYAAFRQRARETPSGVNHFLVPTRSALAVSEKERQEAFEERWHVGGAGLTRAFNDILVNEDANRSAADFVRGKIRQVVRDQNVAELLSPTYLIGTKRLATDTNYYETFNRDNVTLVDIKQSPITAVTPTGILTKHREYELDAIVFATGFDAMTGSLLEMDIAVEGGAELRQLWSHGPRSYLGIMVAGLPNLFTITGPGSPSVLSNVVVSIEQHVNWIAECITYMNAQGARRIEAQETAQEAWVQHVAELASVTLLPRGQSWYVGANVPGKPRVFAPYVGGVGKYRSKCQEIADAGYPGFHFSS